MQMIVPKAILLAFILVICLLPFWIKGVYGQGLTYDVLILVEDEIKESIESSLEQYKQDLADEDWRYYQYNMSATEDESSIKNKIIEFWENHNIKGCVLIGNLSYAQFGLSRYPHACDYYYMDLDGVWNDTDDDGVFELHTGDVDPEIWVGRIGASKVQGNRTELINSYFQKNHDYRINASFPTWPRRALAYVDNGIIDALPINFNFTVYLEYVENTTVCLSSAYSTVTTVYDTSECGMNTYAGNYKSRLTYGAGYEWVWLYCHGYPPEDYKKEDYYHNFYRCKHPEEPSVDEYSVYWHFYRNDAPKAFFYLWDVCRAAEFDEEDCLGSSAIFGNSWGLVSIGVTYSGLPECQLFEFFDRLKRGRCIGEAFKTLDNSTLNHRNTLKWVILGDPTLRVSTPPSNQSPDTPSTPEGERSGHQGLEYNYFTNSTDQDGDDIRYLFDWGDGTSETVGPFRSGVNASASHKWEFPGTYEVTVRAKDLWRGSTWGNQSQSLNVTITERIWYIQNAKCDSTYWKLFWNNTSTSTSRNWCKPGWIMKGYLGVKIYKGTTCISGDDVIEVGYWYNLQYGWRSTTWNCSGQNVTGTYIKVEIYYKFAGDSDWTYGNIAFKTETFAENTILSATTWTIYLYGEYHMEYRPLRHMGPPGQNRCSITFYWGSMGDDESRIEDMIFTHG